jgi:hypothetical protein
MNFNTLDDAGKTLIHNRLTECANSFGGANYFLQLLEAIRAGKSSPLLAKNCVFHFDLGMVKWSKVIFEDKLNLLAKARLFEGKNNNLLPKEDDQAYKRVLNLVRALKPIEFKVKPKNIKHGKGFTVQPFEVIDETTTRMDPIFDVLFFAGIDTAKKILKYEPTTTTR